MGISIENGGRGHMDPLLAEYLEKVRTEKVTAHLVLLVDGQLVVGLPVSDRRFVDNSNAMLEERSEVPAVGDDPDFSPAMLKGLRFESREEDAEPQRFVTLDQASVHLSHSKIDMPTMRIDLDAITGWAVAPYEPDEPEVDVSEEQPQPA